MMSEKKVYRRRKLQSKKAAVKAADPARYAAVKSRLPREIRQTMVRPNISNCAQEYVASLVNPFDLTLKPCVPSFFPLPSQKQTSFVRGTFALGTTGFGYCICRATADYDTNAAVISTTSASVGGVGTALNAFTNLTTTLNNKNEYTNANLTNNAVQARIVSYGLRVRYLGREDARNGSVFLIETLDREDINAVSITVTYNFANGHREVPSASRAWHNICFSGPSNPDDIDFQGTGLPLGANYPMGAIISGTAGDVYEFEYIQHTEYTGRSVNSKSPSHTDQKGFDAAVQQVKSVAAAKPVQPSDAKGIFDRFVEAIDPAIKIGSAIAQGAKSIMGIARMEPSSILNQAFQAIRAQSTQIEPLLLM